MAGLQRRPVDSVGEPASTAGTGADAHVGRVTQQDASAGGCSARHTSTAAEEEEAEAGGGSGGGAKPKAVPHVQELPLRDPQC